MRLPPGFWTAERVKEAVSETRRTGDPTAAAQALSARWGVTVTMMALHNAINRAGISMTEARGGMAGVAPAARSSGENERSEIENARPLETSFGDNPFPWLRGGLVGPSASDGQAPAADDFEVTVEEPDPDLSRFVPLIDASRAPKATVESVCNALECSPAHLAALIKSAREAGIAVDVAHDTIAIRAAAPSETPVVVAPPVGERQIIAAISDTHFGSAYCMRAQLRDFIHRAYAAGAREVLHSGDMLDGIYNHGRWELSHHGLSEQTDDAIATLPQLPGLSYHFIAGNHDQTFVERTGVEVGRYIVDRFRAAGRQDLRFHGNSGAYLRVRGLLIHLWHPKGGVPYALSYRLQKRIEAYSPGLKPDVVLGGHLHKSVQICTRGVHGFLVPCWQSGGSAFANSLVGDPAIGGLILSWQLTEHGTVRSLSSELVSYYRGERPRDVEAA